MIFYSEELSEVPSELHPKSTVVRYGSFIELTSMRRRIIRKKKEKGSKRKVVIHKPVQGGSLKTSNLKSLRHSYKSLYMRILCSFHGRPSEKLVTLNFKIPVENLEELYSMLKAFIKKIRRRVHIQYIAIPELTSSRRWHVHLLLKTTDGSNLFFDHQELTDLWGHGGVYISMIEDVEGLADYFTLFALIPPSKLTSPKMKLKYFLLEYYPRTMKIYRASRGIESPKRFIVDREKYLKNIEPYYVCVSNHSKAVFGIDETDGHEFQLNAFNYRTFKRKKKGY